MKNLITIVLLAIATVAYAEIKQLEGYTSNATFYQFTHDEPTNTGDYHDSRNSGQNWLAAQTIKLLVGSECDVWLSNYVQSWYAPIPELDGNVYQMGEGQYGAWQLNGDKTWIGSGESALVTYTDASSGAENSTSAYFLGHFDGGEEIALWMTALPDEGGETVDTMQHVNDADHGTTLASRLDGTHDLAGNVRINFGFTTIPEGEGREWVAFGVNDDNFVPTGQPLPGVLTSALIASVFIAGARKAGKRKKA